MDQILFLNIMALSIVFTIFYLISIINGRKKRLYYSYTIHKDFHFMNDIKRNYEDIVNELLLMEKREDFLDLLSYAGIFIDLSTYFIPDIPDKLDAVLSLYIDGKFVVNPNFVDRKVFLKKINEFHDKWGEMKEC